MRLNIYSDFIEKNSFVIKYNEFVFARLNKINDKWVCWLYHSHQQKNFLKLKDSLAYIEAKFQEQCKTK